MRANLTKVVIETTIYEADERAQSDARMDGGLSHNTYAAQAGKRGPRPGIGRMPGPVGLSCTGESFAFNAQPTLPIS